MKEKLTLLPTRPGCYLMLNDRGDVIYVGKAKNLRNRVKSYFTGSHNAKTALLVSEIADFNFIVTNSEQESLILEFNLIKKYAPHYNIRLIDDKTYPYIEITQEKDPRLIVSRYKEVSAKKRLFGPYPNSYAAQETVKLLYRLYPLRRCEPIAKKPCMYYHLGQCLGPCLHQGPIDYQPNIGAITRFLKGDTKSVLKTLEDKMDHASTHLEFEKALEYRDMIAHVKKTTEKQIMSLNDFKDRDFISFAYNEDDVAIHILNMRGGRILDTHQQVMSYINDVNETVLNYLTMYYRKVLLPDELVFDHQIVMDVLNLYFNKHIIIPKKGDKKKLIDLAHLNAQTDLQQYFKLYRLKQEKTDEALNELSKIIGIRPNHVEVFDNAHIFGTAPIAGMIVFKNYKFERKMYRKFHLKTTTNDDYQAMKEIIYRRLHRLLIENQVQPDLICVDGGKGQVSAATEVVKSLGLNTPILGLKKDKHHRLEGYVYQGSVNLLDKKSALFNLLLQLSEEVHRYTITFHRDTKSRKDYKSILDGIAGLGKMRKQILLAHYQSIDDIKQASIEDLRKLGLPDKVVKALKEGII